MTKRVMMMFVPALLSTGCMLGAMKDQHDAIENMNQQAVANGTAAQDQKRTELYAQKDGVWLCPTAEAARAGAACPGGTDYPRNTKIRVIGQAPDGDVWRAESFDKRGQHLGFVLAAALNELPDLAQVEAFAADLERRFPAARRIPPANLNLADLIGQAKAYKGRFLVADIPMSAVDNTDYDDDGLRFTMLVPAEPGSQILASVQFELKTPAYRRAFADGKRSLSCGGGGYCDSYVVVARYDGELRDRVDERGVVRRLPVFQITEMADRFQTYRAE